MADVFKVPFAAVAEAVDKTPEACRQIASRARRSLRNARARARPGDRHLVDELLTALWLGDMDMVLARLAPDVVCVTDGGAARRAARRPVVGASRVARFLTDLTQRYRDDLTAENVTVNGEPGVVARLGDEVDFVAAFEIEDGLIRTIRLVRNPDKLRLVTARVQLV